MSKQTINTSTATDTLASGFDKVNSNFTEVYNSLIQTGFVVDYFGLTAPSGWIICNGETIGNASSGATARANADTEALFSLLWENLSEGLAPVSGGRGASASIDFAANKTIVLPNYSGRVSVGKDNETFTTLGGLFGELNHVLTESELPSHTHSIPSHTHDIQGAVGYCSSGPEVAPYTQIGSAGGPGYIGTTDSSGSGNSGSSGGGNSHNNIQPSLVVNKIIKL